MKMTYTIDIPFIASFNFWDNATIVNTNDFRTTIFHKWYKDLKLESNILINIGKSYNWRSWSYININSDRVGNWKVVIEDSSGFKYDSLEFSISQR